jgi:hypothetical protein
MVLVMGKTTAKYTKCNCTPESCQVLNMIAAERRLYVYEVLDQALREKYPEYFAKIECQKQL